MHRLIAIALWIIFVIGSFGASFLYLFAKLWKFGSKLFVYVS